MKRFSSLLKARLSLLLSLALLAGMVGAPAHSASATKNKKITAEVDFRIVIVGDVLTPFDKPRAVGRVSFAGFSHKGDFLEAVGAVFIVIDVIGAGAVPDLRVDPILGADLRLDLAGNDNEWRVTGALRNIDFDTLEFGKDSQGRTFVEGVGSFVGRVHAVVD